MHHNTEILIRPERTEDYSKIELLVKEAFASAEHSDGDEHNLVCRLRQTEDYIHELSLVAIENDMIVGYIMFSRIFIDGRIAVAPAPVAVAVEFQRKGIGSLLVTAGHDIARRLGYSCSVVLGSPDYYSRFGYLKASVYGIMAPFDIPDEYYMVCGLGDRPYIPKGMVKYSDAFGII